MLVFYTLVVGLVAASNIHWQWTPNRYLPGLTGFGLAYGIWWLWQFFRSR